MNPFQWMRKPLIGLVAMALIVVGGILMLRSYRERRMNELAGIIKEQVATVWVGHPVLHKAAFEEVLLERLSATEYTGVVVCVIANERFEVPLDVIDGKELRWNLRPKDAGTRFLEVCTAEP